MGEGGIIVTDCKMQVECMRVDWGSGGHKEMQLHCPPLHGLPIKPGSAFVPSVNHRFYGLKSPIVSPGVNQLIEERSYVSTAHLW